VRARHLGPAGPRHEHGVIGQAQRRLRDFPIAAAREPPAPSLTTAKPPSDIHVACLLSDRPLWYFGFRRPIQPSFASPRYIRGWFVLTFQPT
jgi:hypothetical protein